MGQPSEREAWVVRATTVGVGGETLNRLLGRFGGPADVLAAASSGALESWLRSERPGVRRVPVSAPVADRLRRWPEQLDLVRTEVARLGLWLVTPLDADFPARLGDLDEPPTVLFGQGDRSAALNTHSIAVVGTRRPTPYGRALAARVATRLVEAGAVVVSGLAVGIDGAVHAATIEAGGATVGIIGGGHLHPGPRAHADLRRAVLDAGGAIVSEHLPATRPSRGTYPRRNRIIAALAAATIVVEAPARSGALITAGDALTIGRPVLVTPGRIGDWATMGSLRLLHDSPATIVPDLDALLDEVWRLEPWRNRRQLPRREGDEPGSTALATLSGAQLAVAAAICRAPAGLDRLVEETGLEPAAVAGAVTLLLMRGWLRPVGPAYLPAGALLQSAGAAGTSVP
ncbi:MAG TPA: DNA-processing protein DprA [Candidatus Limnocylindrales bacterium]|nr:DNA-processing protein DprA [Candidatus Limnocylindrales bacterium]